MLLHKHKQSQITHNNVRPYTKRVCIDAVRQGEGEEPFLVAVFAPEDFKPASAGGGSGVAPESTEFVVWVCDKLAHSRNETLNWTACGSIVGTKVQSCPVSAISIAESMPHLF